MKFYKKIISAVTAMLLLAAILFSSLYIAKASPLDSPMLYYNDSTWAREDRSPLKYLDDMYYVPLTLFAQLKNTKVRVNNSLNTFVITHSGLYISFDASTNIATDQADNLFYSKTYKLDYGERYVPAQVVCKYIGLGFDTFTCELTGETAVRITDGTEEMTFRELLETYNKDMLKTEADITSQTTSREISSSSVTSQDTPDKPLKLLGRRTLYITFTDGISSYTGAILDTLLKYGYTATFFIDESDINDYPITLSRIISEGHKIGLKPRKSEAYTDLESLVNELDSTNRLLYRVYKIKTRTVIPDIVYGYNDALSQDIKDGRLADEGYSVWKTTLARADGIYSDDRAAELMINGIWTNNTVVFDFGSNPSSSHVLDKTLEFIYANRENCDVRLADSAYIPPN